MAKCLYFCALIFPQCNLSIKYSFTRWVKEILKPSAEKSGAARTATAGRNLPKCALPRRKRLEPPRLQPVRPRHEPSRISEMAHGISGGDGPYYLCRFCEALPINSKNSFMIMAVAPQTTRPSTSKYGTLFRVMPWCSVRSMLLRLVSA